MSISLFSGRAAVAGVVGAGVLSGAMLFGGIPMAAADSTPAPADAVATPASTDAVAPADAGHVTLASIWHHDPHHRHDLHHSVNIL